MYCASWRSSVVEFYLQQEIVVVLVVVTPIELAGAVVVAEVAVVAAGIVLFVTAESFAFHEAFYAVCRR